MYILYGRSLQSELSQNSPKSQAHQVFSTQGAASQTRALPALSSDGSVEAIITALSPLADLIGTCTNTRHFASQSVMTLGLPLSLRYWTNLLDRKVLKKCNDFSDLEQTIRRFMLGNSDSCGLMVKIQSRPICGKLRERWLLSSRCSWWGRTLIDNWQTTSNTISDRQASHH